MVVSPSDQTKIDGLPTRRIGYETDECVVWTSHLTLAERDALRANPIELGAASYGKAVQRELDARIGDLDSELSGLFNAIGGPNKWDYEGIGAASGQRFELTTEAGIPSHFTRLYGPTVEFVYYTRPDDYLVQFFGG